MKVITTNLLNRFWKNGVLPIKNTLSSKVNITDIVNNLTTTVANKALDARQGKALDDKIIALNRNLQETNTKYAYNTKAYAANILTFAESLPDGTFCTMQYDGYSASGTPINGAPSNSSGTALITKTGEKYITIIAVPYTGGQFTRSKNNGTWLGWK